MRFPIRPVALALPLVAIAACGKKTSEEKLQEATKNPPPSVKAGLDKGVTSLKALGLSSNLKVDLPKGMKRATTSLALLQTETKLSAEACRMRNEFRTAALEIATMRRDLCRIEAHSAEIPFGKKLTATWGHEGSTDTFGLWIDDKTEGRLTISLCVAGKLAQKYVITGGDGKALQGSLKVTRQWTEQATGRVQDTSLGGWFDTGVTVAGRRNSGLHARFTDTQGNDKTLGLFIGLQEKGANAFQLQLTDAKSTYSQVAVAKSDANGGMILFGDKTALYPSAFDATGAIATADARAETKAGGALHVAFADLPGFLPADLQPGRFEESDWDCSGGETFVFNPGGKYNDELQKCEAIANEGTPWEACGGAEFQSGATTDVSKKVEATEKDPVGLLSKKVFAK